jgi:hypothetical protein
MLRITDSQLGICTKLWLSGKLSREHCLLSVNQHYPFRVYRCLRSYANEITQDARPKIVIAPLTLNDKMEQRACSSLLCPYRQQILWLYITMTNSLFTYLTYGTNNHWHSVDAHSQNGAASVSLSLLLINAAYISFMNVCIQFPLRLPKMQDQYSLTRRWLSVSGLLRECFSLVFDDKGWQYIRKGQWYTDVNIFQLAIEWLSATITRKTRKPEPEIGTNRSSQTPRTRWVDWYGSGFCLRRCSTLGFWTGLEPNWTVLAVGTRSAGGLPGPVANSTHMLSQCSNIPVFSTAFV